MSFAGAIMVLIVFLGVVGFLFGVWLGDSVQIAAMGSWVSGQLAVGVVFGILGAQAGALLNPKLGERRDRRRNDRRQAS